MLIVTAGIIVKEGKAEEFIKATEKLLNETRKEAGNISYRLLQDTEDKNKLSFLEEWESKEDLDQHMKTPHFQEFGKISAELAAAPADIKVFAAQPV